MTTSTTLVRSRAAILRLALVGVVAVGIAGCSSDAKKSEPASAKRLKPAASVTDQTQAPASTTSAASTSPACTVGAATTALGDVGHALDITCGGGWAAGAGSNAYDDFAFLLHDVNGTWQSIDNDANQAVMQQACASTNPLGIPDYVLQVSPCRVS